MYGYKISESEFNTLLSKEDYYKLTPKLYYSDNQDEIIQWCSNLKTNNYIHILYFLIRVHSQNKFNTDSDLIKTCTKYMFKCIYLAIMHINTYKEINREFPILKILCNKLPEKLEKYIDEQILYETYNIAQDEIVQIIKNLSEKVCPGFNDENIIPDPYFIYKTRAGYISYPAIHTEKIDENELKEISSKFVTNFEGRIDKYHEAILYCNERFRKVLDSYSKTKKLNFKKYFT